MKEAAAKNQVDMTPQKFVMKFDGRARPDCSAAAAVSIIYIYTHMYAYVCIDV